MTEPVTEGHLFRARLSLLLVALTLWAVNHPIVTYWHDGRLYSVLALHWLAPEPYASDPFFLYGSQDDYSLFSVLYGPLVAHLGLRAAYTSVMVLGGLLWCFAALRVATSCMPRTWLAGAAVLALAALKANYSPNGITFFLNENFATARTLAFPLGALALAECVNGRWRRAVLFALAAMLMHPLLGVWPLVLAILWPMSWRWRWPVILFSALALATLALSGVGPFARIDAEWEPIVRNTRDVFVHLPWGEKPLRWQDYGFQLLLLLTAVWHLRMQAPAAARLYLLSALIAFSGLLAAATASWFLPSHLVIESQLWRSMWLAAYLMPVALAHLLWLLAKVLRPQAEGTWPWWLLAVAALLLLLRDWPLYVLLAWWLGLGCMQLHVRRYGHAAFQQMLLRLARIERQRWFPPVVICLMLMPLPVFQYDLWSLGLSVPIVWDFPFQEVVGLFLVGGFGLGFVLIAYACFRFSVFSLWPCLLALLLAFIISKWDVRAVATKAWEARGAFGISGGIRELIRPGDVVLWQSKRMPLETWFELRTAHYASYEQATGIVFSRQKTFDLIERTHRIRAARLHESHADDKPYDLDDTFGFIVPEGDGIPLLCQDKGLDWVVIQPKGLPQLPGGVRFDYVDASGLDGVLHAYRCSDFRSLQ